MKERDIMHESPNGRYWVLRRVSTNARIAPLGSMYYQIFKNGATASESTPFVSANLDRTIAACDRFAEN